MNEINSRRIFTFRPRYFLCTVVLFFNELLIALCLHDRIIRPYIGDLLVVILIYCFCRSFFQFPVYTTALAVLLFSNAVEALQAYRLIYHLHLEHSQIANIVLGNLFEWMDVLAYTIGFVFIIFVENKRKYFNYTFR